MPLKVLYLHHMEQIGGAENSLRLLLKHLDPNRVRPWFGGPTTGPFPERLVRDGIPVCSVPFGSLRNVPQLVRSAQRVRDLIRQHDIHLLHSNGPRSNICAGLAGRMTSIPVVWHARNLLYGNMWDVDRFCGALATRVICNSDAVRKRFLGSPVWAKAVTIHNAIDTEEFNPSVSGETFRRELGISSSEILIGMVGRIDPDKGHEHFVQAAFQLLRRNTRARFVIVGGSAAPEETLQAERLRRRIKDAGFDKGILCTGFRSDIPSVMGGLDILVLTYRFEACGRVLLEAMASGTAIVAVNSGGTPEVVGDGREGLLVTPKDDRALANALCRLSENPSLRKSLGQAGIVRAHEEFTIDRYVNRTIQTYTEALEDQALAIPA